MRSLRALLEELAATVEAPAAKSISSRKAK